MSFNKLNVLHWHITDTHSFPFYSKRVPEMVAYGAYSPYQVYYPEDVIELVKYARVRGVRIVPELDTPAHVGNGWQWAEKDGKGRMAVCVNQEHGRTTALNLHVDRLIHFMKVYTMF